MPKLTELFAEIRLDFSKALGDVNKSDSVFNKIGKKLTSVGKTLSRNLTLPLLAVGTAVTKVAVDFDSSMTKIETLVGINADKVDEWRESLLSLAGEVGKAPLELAEALFVVTSAGIDASVALDVVRLAAQASAIGLGETKEVARATTAIMQAYAAENITAAQATDILTATVRLGNLEASELAPVLGRVVGIAASLGVSFQELGANIATFTRLGASSAEAVTALRGILQALAVPGEAAGKALESVGLSADELKRILKEEGLQAALELLAEKFKDNEEGLKAVIPNVRALSGVLGTAGVQGESYAEILEKINLHAKEGKILQDAFARQTETAAFKLAQAKAAIFAAAISLSDLFLPAVKIAAEFIKRLADRFRELDPGIKKAIVVVAAIAAAMGPLLVVAGLVASAIGSLITIAPLMGAAFAVATGPIGLVVGALVLLLASSEDARNALASVAKALGGTALTIIKSYVKEIKAAVQGFVEWKATISAAIKPIADFIAVVTKSITPVKKLTDNLNLLAEAYKAAQKIVVDAILNMAGVRTLLDSMSGASERAAKATEDLTDEWSEMSDEALDAALEASLLAETLDRLATDEDKAAAAAANAAAKARDLAAAEELAAAATLRFDTSMGKLDNTMSLGGSNIEIMGEKLTLLKSRLGELEGAAVKDEKAIAALTVEIDKETKVLAEAGGALGTYNQMTQEATKWGTLAALTTARQADELENLGKPLKTLPPILADVVDGLKRLTLVAKVDLKSLVSDTVKKLGTSLSGTAGFLQTVMSSTGPWGAAIATGMGVLKAFGIDVEGFFNNLVGKIGSAIKGVLSSIAGALGFGGGGGLSAADQLIRDTMDTVREAFRDIGIEADVLGSSFDSTGAKISLLEQAIIDLRTAGVDPTDPAIQRLSKALALLKDGADAAAAAVLGAGSVGNQASQGGTFIPRPEPFLGNPFTVPGLSEAQIQINEFFDDINDQVAKARLLAESLGKPFDEAAFRANLFEEALIAYINANGTSVEVIGFLQNGMIQLNTATGDAAVSLGELNQEISGTGAIMEQADATFREFNQSIAQIVSELDGSVADLGVMGELAAATGDDFNSASAEMRLIKDAMLELLRLGIDPMDARFQDLIVRLDQAADAAREFDDALRVASALERLESGLRKLDAELQAGVIDTVRLAESRLRLLKSTLADLIFNGADPASDAFKNLQEQIAGAEQAVIDLGGAAEDLADASGKAADNAEKAAGATEKNVLTLDGGNINIDIGDITADLDDRAITSLLRQILESVDAFIPALLFSTAPSGSTLRGRLSGLESALINPGMVITDAGVLASGGGSGLPVGASTLGDIIIINELDSALLTETVLTNTPGTYRLRMGPGAV